MLCSVFFLNGRALTSAALLLPHAQTLDWYTYSGVLSEPSTKFHVFAVDYPGHGKTAVPANCGYLADGTLNGAMSKRHAGRAVLLIRDCAHVRIDPGHGTNLEAPDQFIRIAEEFSPEQFAQ